MLSLDVISRGIHPGLWEILTDQLGVIRIGCEKVVGFCSCSTMNENGLILLDFGRCHGVRIYSTVLNCIAELCS